MQCSIDLADAEQENKLDDSSKLYRHYDAHGRLLYVGVAVNPQKRLLQHAREGATWVAEVARSTFERFRTHQQVLDAEIAAIKHEAPLWNIVHADIGRLCVLRPIRAAKGKSKIIHCSIPAEPCFARKGVLVSFRTQGRAEHFDCTFLNDHCDLPNYQAVVDWMEWFGYHYEHECVVSEKGEFCATWLDVLTIVKDDWHYEFVVRPKLGFASDISKFARPLWKVEVVLL